jgi:hypothetical protein
MAKLCCISRMPLDSSGSNQTTEFYARRDLQELNEVQLPCPVVLFILTEVGTETD